MSWFSGLFGRGAASEPDQLLSPEIAAIFEKLARYLESEVDQNERLPEPLRSLVKNGLSCDHLPTGSGPFGRVATNPIPVNGRMGELLYLSSLVHSSGPRLLFHRLGSINKIDVYETVSLDGRAWDILYLDFYHPRKSKEAPAGFAIDERPSKLFYGANQFVERFPHNLHMAIAETFQRVTGVSMCPPEIRQAIEATRFAPPRDHSGRVSDAMTLIKAAGRPPRPSAKAEARDETRRN
jgi:hypothetical protein